MALSDRVSDVRARTHIQEGHPQRHATSKNDKGRPTLRVIPGSTHIQDNPPPPRRDHGTSDHFDDAADDFATHPVTATHPPTVTDAAGDLWLDADRARHGLPGQLAAAAVGLVQVTGLAACWGIAHIFFATKTRAAIFLLMIAAGFAIYGIAVHA